MHYQAPVNELRFALYVHARLPEILTLPAAEGLDADTVTAVLAEAAKFAETVLAPTNRTGDLHGARLHDGQVATHPDLAAAFAEFCAAGWPGLRAPAAYGGQGAPAAVAAACEEMWCAANLAFSLLPMLTLGAVETIAAHGSEAQKQTYLPPMCAGRWSGTMNLTEAQAGSDLAQVATRAVPQADGSYAISGQKIFITWGEQELTENIVHLVLARLPDAPAGIKGISLFIVPKYLPDNAGRPSARNHVQAVGLEHKLGIHASPTCVMQFDQAQGYLVGEAGKGLNYMFTMMNHARLGVGIEGHAVAERACQAALAYARGRVQSRPIGGGAPVAIVRHPDVRRMLLVQKATLAAQRGLYMQAAAAIDTAHGHADEAMRKQALARLNYLIPIVKSWCTDNGTVLTNLAMQVYGGMGYVEESGVAQYVRDVRITPIYEGTNGIQALDLLGRKTVADDAAVARALLDEATAAARALDATEADMATALERAVAVAHASVDAVLAYHRAAPEQAAVCAQAYLQHMATVLGAAVMARNVAAAHKGVAGLDADFYRTQRQLARVYFAQVLPQAETYAAQIALSGSADAVLAADMDAL